MKKKLTSFLLAMVMCMSLCVPAWAADIAAEDPLWIVKVDSNGEIYLENTQTQEMMIEAFEIDEFGNKINIDLADHVHTLNNVQPYPPEELGYIDPGPDNLTSTEDGVPFAAPYFIYNYHEEEKSQVNGSPQKASADSIGGTIQTGYSVTVSESFGGNISISTAVKEAITISASFNWTKSASTSSSFSVTYTVPEGKTGYVQFTPYLMYTKGTMLEKKYLDGVLLSSNSYSVWGRTPKTLPSGLADGRYELVIK